MSLTNLPSGWRSLTLAEVGEWRGGGTPSKQNNHYWDGDIPWVSPKDMKTDEISVTIDHISTAAVEGSSTKLIPAESVLFVTRSGILSHSFPVSVNTVPVTINQDLKAITPAQGVDTSFLAWYLRDRAQEIITVHSKYGTTVPSIETSSLKELPVLVPPLSEQRRIVDKIESLFSEIDQGVAALEKARRLLDIYRQAVLKHAFEGELTATWREEHAGKLESPEELLTRIQREREKEYDRQIEEWKTDVAAWEESGVVGKKPRKPSKSQRHAPLNPDATGIEYECPDDWRIARLSELSYIRSGMSVSKNRKISDPASVPYLRVANVQRGSLDLTEVKEMRIERSDLSRYTLRQWDVLFNEGGDRDKLGRGWIWEGQLSLCITQNHVFSASPYLPSEYHSKFISYWGNSFGQKYFEETGKQTTNLASINKGSLSDLPVPVPSLDEQRLIIDIVEQELRRADTVEMAIEQSLRKARDLRRSILNLAFTGMLVPQESESNTSSTSLKQRASVRQQSSDLPENHRRIQS